ncbi:hypothetical protein [Paenibacillus beijingensis]|uniref:hypothetical protein n=1 Tax=Paenibacillus beijingensis TaxID=1126833 RepID=UPI000A64A932|nr:hypothetical protein [Paenibacillus beijingensis]
MSSDIPAGCCSGGVLLSGIMFDLSNQEKSGGAAQADSTAYTVKGAFKPAVESGL